MLVVNLRITNLCKFPDMNVMERAKRIQVYISLWLFWIVGRSYLEYVEDFMYKSTNRELSSSWNTFSATSLECLVKTNCFLLKAWSLYCLAFYKQVASYLFRFASIPKSGNGLCVISGYILEVVILQRKFWLTCLPKCLIQRHFSYNTKTFILCSPLQVIHKDISIYLKRIGHSISMVWLHASVTSLYLYKKSNCSFWGSCSLVAFRV